MKMDSLTQRKQELEKKEIQLKESVLKFDKFLKVKRVFFLTEQLNYFLNLKLTNQRKTMPNFREPLKRLKMSASYKKPSKKRSSVSKKRSPIWLSSKKNCNERCKSLASLTDTWSRVWSMLTSFKRFERSSIDMKR